MKKTLITIFLLVPLMAATTAFGQQPASKKDFLRDYSRWSVGVNGGISWMWGDFKSVAYDKTYIGQAYDVQVGFQLTPTVGLRGSFGYGYNKLGPKDYELNYWLQPNGITFYGLPENAAAKGALEYRYLYSIVESYTIGLNAEFNVNNFFGSKANRRWTVLVSPGAYLQTFRPTVYRANDDRRFTTNDIANDYWKLSIGGDVALRYRVSRSFDLQLRSQGIWIFNCNFDGIISEGYQPKNGVITAQLGAIWKFNAAKHKGNMLYAPRVSSYYKNALAAKPKKVEVIRHQVDTVVVEVPVEKVVIKEVGGKELQCDLPTIHFVRGKTNIDETKYAFELQTIVGALKAAPKAKIQIWGFADHTGGKEINDNISYGRAEALKQYLIKHGIAANRITNIVGMGKDPSLTGEEAYSVKARRSAVVND